MSTVSLTGRFFRSSYEYDPTTETTTFKMPGKVHQEGVRVATALISQSLEAKKEQLRVQQNGVGKAFLDGIRPSGSISLKLINGCYKMPDQSFADGNSTVQPSVIVLVASSTQTWDDVQDEAEDYIIGTTGLVRAVITVKLAVVEGCNKLQARGVMRIGLLRPTFSDGFFTTSLEFDEVSIKQNAPALAPDLTGTRSPISIQNHHVPFYFFKAVC